MKSSTLRKWVRLLGSLFCWTTPCFSTWHQIISIETPCYRVELTDTTIPKGMQACSIGEQLTAGLQGQADSDFPPIGVKAKKISLLSRVDTKFKLWTYPVSSWKLLQTWTPTEVIQWMLANTLKNKIKMRSQYKMDSQNRQLRIEVDLLKKELWMW